jgi:YD repeat-containing protein
MTVHAKPGVRTGQSGVLAAFAGGLVDPAADSARWSPNIFATPRGRPFALWLCVVAIVVALSPVNHAAANGAPTLDTVTVRPPPPPPTLATVVVRPPPLDSFNTNSAYLSAPTPTFSSNLGPGYFYVPTQGVSDRLKSPVVPEEGCDKAKNPDLAGNPVVLANGNKIEREVDFLSKGEAGLHLQRVYNHYWAGIGLFGKHWISNFDFKLRFGGSECYPRPGGGTCAIGSNTYIAALRPDGSTNGYQRNSSDGVFYETKASGISKIVRQANGDFVLYGEGDQVETYSFAGYIKSVNNAQGVGWTFTYANTTYPIRVTHTSGRYVEFTWTGSQLTEVRDPAGTSYRYTYTADQFGAGLHRLASVSQPGTTITYHYELAGTPAALTGKSFNGVRFSTFSYGAGTRPAATQTTHSGIETWKFSYEDMSGAPGGGGVGITITTIVNPLGKTTKNVYKDGKILHASGLASPNCASTVVSTTYNATTGYPEVVTDASGNKTAFVYNAKGQLLSQTEAYETPLARTTIYEWDAAKNRQTKVTVVGLSETSYSYASHGRLASVSVRDLATGQVRTTTYHYTHHSNGVLASERVDAPLTADDVTMTYSTAGDLLTVTNASNQVTTYANHNALGQPGRITSPSGAVVEYEYDTRGRVVVERTFPNGGPVVTRYTYGASGLLDAKTTSDGNEVFYHYDIARRLIQEDLTEPGGGFAVKRYTYDAMSNPIKIEIGREN